MATFTVGTSRGWNKALTRRYKKLKRGKETDVILYPGKPLVSDGDKRSGKKKFRCHSWILRANSNTLKTLIEKAKKDQCSKIFIPEVHQNMMVTVLRYMYYGECTFGRADAHEMFVTARYLQMEELEQQCTRALCEEISLKPQSVLDYYRLGFDANLQRTCEGVIRTKLRSIESTTKYMRLSHADVCMFLYYAVNGVEVELTEAEDALYCWVTHQARGITRRNLVLPLNYDFCNPLDFVAAYFDAVVAYYSDPMAKFVFATPIDQLKVLS